MPVVAAKQCLHSTQCQTGLGVQAVERAISELTRLQKPLRTESDVTELSMGARSKEKVLEIMETGTLRRNEMLADDEQQQVIQLVSMTMTSSLYRLSLNGDKIAHECCNRSGAYRCEQAFWLQSIKLLQHLPRCTQILASLLLSA